MGAQIRLLACLLLTILFVSVMNPHGVYARSGDSPQEKAQSDDLLGDSDLLGDNDDLLSGDDDSDKLFEQKEPQQAQSEANKAHLALFAESKFPSAITCATCHPKHYKEWSVSQHAYAQLSPLMLSMQNAINKATATTNGDFCLRCHAPVGSELNENFTASNLDRHPASREGVTCVACHRVNKDFGKVTGRISLERGDIYSTIYGPSGNEELKNVLSKPETYRVTDSAEEPGRAIHGKAEKFFDITSPRFCGACHDVIAPTGLRIEEAFSEFRNTPAAKRGTTCQDCHMGKVQGKESGYDHGPAAIIGKVPTKDRKITNHFFAGPDYSIIHPGIFPQNVRANEFKTMREWLEFNLDEGWGTDAFENSAGKDYPFPEAWQSIDDRYEAAEIIAEQKKALAWAKTKRIEVLKNAFDLGDIVIEDNDGELEFSIDVKNISDGHLMPNGFDAERTFHLHVQVKDPQGKLVYESGDRDPNGDLRDLHSLYVKNGELPLDRELFNLQSKFMVRLTRGGEREQVLPVPVSLSALPFIRPDTRPSILYGQPKGARKHRKGIEPLGSRTAHYSVDSDLLTEPGEYQISIKFISQALPISLVTATMHAGFDYKMTPRQVADKLVEGAVVIRERNLSVNVKGI